MRRNVSRVRSGLVGLLAGALSIGGAIGVRAEDFVLPDTSYVASDVPNDNGWNIEVRFNEPLINNAKIYRAPAYEPWTGGLGAGRQIVSKPVISRQDGQRIDLSNYIDANGRYTWIDELGIYNLDVVNERWDYVRNADGSVMFEPSSPLLEAVIGEYSLAGEANIGDSSFVDHVPNYHYYRYKVVIEQANRSPEIQDIPDVTVDENGGVLIRELIARDADGDSLALSISSDSGLEAYIVPGDDRFENTINIILDGDWNGSAGFTVGADDLRGGVDTESFNLTVNPMTDIRGRLIDTDTWEPANLRGWVAALGDTVWTDINGNYRLQVSPRSLIDLIAGYKESNGNPASFVRTVRNLDGMSDQDSLDIAVVSYLNMNTTPEEFRIMMDEANFGLGGTTTTRYEGAKALRRDIVWYLSKKGRHGEEFSEEELVRIQEIINNDINSSLNYPLPIVVDRSDWIPRTNEEKIGKIFIEKYSYSGGGGSIADFDYDRDGRIDHVAITLLDPINIPVAVREEAASAIAGFDQVVDPRLEDKTIYYEYSGVDITSADIKSIKFIEAITHDIGRLYPKMPIDEVLRLQ